MSNDWLVNHHLFNFYSKIIDSNNSFLKSTLEILINNNSDIHTNDFREIIMRTRTIEDNAFNIVSSILNNNNNNNNINTDSINNPITSTNYNNNEIYYDNNDINHHDDNDTDDDNELENTSVILEDVIIRPTNREIEYATTNTTYSNLILPVNNRCPISLVEFESNTPVTMILYCGHVFSQSYLQEWFNLNVRCPLCRYDIRNYTRNVNFNNIVNGNNSLLRFINDNYNNDIEIDNDDDL